MRWEKRSYNISFILVKRVFKFLILFIVLTWKIVKVSKVSVLYIYIDDRLFDNLIVKTKELNSEHFC